MAGIPHQGLDMLELAGGKPQFLAYLVQNCAFRAVQLAISVRRMHQHLDKHLHQVAAPVTFLTKLAQHIQQWKIRLFALIE